MDTYSYIDNAGKTQQIQANSPEEATKNAINIKSDSGVYKGILGGTTPPPTGTDNPGIASSTDATNSLNNDGNQLDKMTNQPDPYMEYLQKKANTLMTTESQPGLEEKNAAAQGGRLQEKTQADYTAYKAGLETLGIKSGLSRYAPELQADRMIQAANNETAKIQEIQDKEDLAIAKAKQARLDKDATALKETLGEIRQLKKDKADELQRQLTRRTQDATVAGNIATYAFKQLQTLPDEQKETFLLQLAKDNQISPATLAAALAEEQDRQTKFNLTTSLQEKALNKADSGPKLTVGDASSDLDNAIKNNNILGDDGYMAPETWIDARDRWVKAGLTASTFNTLYKRYLNPLSYEKAGFTAGIANPFQ